MKRFWKEVALAATENGWGIALDGRALKTPARADLVVPSAALGEAIASEWRECGEEIDPRAMPLTGLANAAVDHAPRPAFAADLGQYAEGDLLCYRADHPPALIGSQAAAWDPLLALAKTRYSVDFIVTSGIVHVPQPAPTIARLTAALTVASPFQRAALSPLITIGGSLITALLLLDRAIDLQTAWDGVSLDERWQIEQWGADHEAVASLASRERDFAAAAHFLRLLD